MSGDLRTRLLRGGLGIGGLSVAELALGLGTAILLARDLGAAGLGAYSLGIAVSVLAGLPVECGLPGLVTREIAHAREEGAAAVSRAVLRFSGTVIVGASALVLPLAFLMGTIFAPRLGAAPALLPLALALIPVNALANAIGGALAGRRRVVAGNLAQKLIRPGVFALALAAAMLVAPGWLTPARAMALHLCAAVAALAFAMLQLARHFPDVRAARRTAVPWRGWGAATLRLGLINGLRLAEPQFLLLLTGLFASIESVGLLRIAQRGAALASIGVSIAVIVAAPEFARLNGAGQRDRLQRLLTRVARAGALASGAGVLLVLGAGHWILGSFFGPEFIAAWTALLILASAEMVRAVFGPAAVLLNMLRHEGVTALALCLSATASAVVAWVLIPSIDASGAALGSLFGVTLASVLLWWHGRRAVTLETSVLGPATLPRKP